MDKQKVIELLEERVTFIKNNYQEVTDYREALEYTINCLKNQGEGMTVRELKEMTLDTNIIVRNHNTGEFFRSFSECYEKKVCKMYAKITKCSKKSKQKADLIVFAK